MALIVVARRVARLLLLLLMLLLETCVALVPLRGLCLRLGLSSLLLLLLLLLLPRVQRRRRNRQVSLCRDLSQLCPQARLGGFRAGFSPLAAHLGGAQGSGSAREVAPVRRELRGGVLQFRFRPQPPFLRAPPPL